MFLLDMLCNIWQPVREQQDRMKVELHIARLKLRKAEWERDEARRALPAKHLCASTAECTKNRALAHEALVLRGSLLPFDGGRDVPQCSIIESDEDE